ncbi:MAG TPA: calcium-binding protein, partial [Magnetospirillum sp.]|nr:calcium-binding protein [Magnetospirillum sp.]
GSTQYGMLSDTQTNNVIAIGGTRPDQVEFDGSEIQFSAGGKLKSKDIALGGSISGSTNGSYYSDLLIAFGTAVALGSAHTRPLIPQGSVTLLGGDGDDRLVNAVTGTVGTVSHVGGQGSDFIVAGQNRDVIVWQGDSDYIDTVSGFSAASNDQILITGRATDFHWVTNHADGSSSWSGLVNGYGYGIHFSQGQGGADQVAFNNTVVFSQGGVFKSGNSGIIAGGTGDDLLMAFGAASAGAVTLQGNAGADLLYDYSSAGKTVVFDGGAGNDVMTGGGGNDTFLGGDGADTMYGGSGANTFTGGGGNDIIYVSVGNKSANDLVTDFNAGADTINVTTTVDGSPLSAADFIWNQSTSTLSRADGVGGGLQFSNSTIFSAADFTNQSIRFNTGATAYGYVYSSTAYASINGSTGDDLMLAFGMGSTLAGGDGDDRLMSFASAANYSELRGGAGNDVYVLGAAHDRVVWTPETDGTDVIHGFDVTADYVEIRSSGSIVNEMTWESSLGKLAYFDGFTTSYLFFADGDRPDQVAFASGRVTFVVDGSQSGSVISSIGASLTGDSVGDDLLISTATGFASLQVNLTDGSNDVAVLNSGSETVVWSVSHDGMEVAVQNFDASKDVISCDSIIAGDLRWDADYSQFVYYNQDAQITTTLMIDGDRPDEVAFDGSETLFFNSVLKSADSGTLTGTSEGDLLMGLADSTHGVTFNGGQGDDVLVGGGGADRFNVGFTDSDKVVIDQFDWHADTLSITRNGFAAADFRMESWDDGLFSGFGLYSEADQSLDLAGKAIFFTTPQDIEVDGSRVTFAGGGVFDIQDGVGSIAGSSGDDLLYAKGEIGGGASISLSGGAGDDALIAKSVGSGTVILNGGTGDDTMETSATCGVTFAYSGVRSLSRSGETDSLIVKDGDKITFSDSDWAALTFGSSTALNKVMGGSVNIMFDDTNSQIIIDMPTNGSPTGNHTIGAEDFYIQLQGMNDSYTISDVLIDNTTHSLTI